MCEAGSVASCNFVISILSENSSTAYHAAEIKFVLWESPVGHSFSQLPIRGDNDEAQMCHVIAIEAAIISLILKSERRRNVAFPDSLGYLYFILYLKQQGLAPSILQQAIGTIDLV